MDTCDLMQHIVHWMDEDNIPVNHIPTCMFDNMAIILSCMLFPPPPTPHGSACPIRCLIIPSKAPLMLMNFIRLLCDGQHMKMLNLTLHKVDVLNSRSGGTLFKSQNWHFHLSRHRWYIQVNDAITRSLILTGHIYLSTASTMWLGVDLRTSTKKRHI